MQSCCDVRRAIAVRHVFCRQQSSIPQLDRAHRRGKHCVHLSHSHGALYHGVSVLPSRWHARMRASTRLQSQGRHGESGSSAIPCSTIADMRIIVHLTDLDAAGGSNNGRPMWTDRACLGHNRGCYGRSALHQCAIVHSGQLVQSYCMAWQKAARTIDCSA